MSTWLMAKYALNYFLKKMVKYTVSSFNKQKNKTKPNLYKLSYLKF